MASEYKLVGVQFTRELRVFGVPRGSIGSNQHDVSLAWDEDRGVMTVMRNGDGAFEEILPAAIAVLSWRKSDES